MLVQLPRTLGPLNSHTILTINTEATENTTNVMSPEASQPSFLLTALCLSVAPYLGHSPSDQHLEEYDDESDPDGGLAWLDDAMTQVALHFEPLQCVRNHQRTHCCYFRVSDANRNVIS